MVRVECVKIFNVARASMATMHFSWKWLIFPVSACGIESGLGFGRVSTQPGSRLSDPGPFRLLKQLQETCRPVHDVE